MTGLRSAPVQVKGAARWAETQKVPQHEVIVVSGKEYVLLTIIDLLQVHRKNVGKGTFSQIFDNKWLNSTAVP